MFKSLFLLSIIVLLLYKFMRAFSGGAAKTTRKHTEKPRKTYTDRFEGEYVDYEEVEEKP